MKYNITFFLSYKFCEKGQTDTYRNQGNLVMNRSIVSFCKTLK